MSVSEIPKACFPIREFDSFVETNAIFLDCRVCVKWQCT
jgi:hypothetical protein